MRVATLAIGLLALTGLVNGQSSPADTSLPSSVARFLSNPAESLTQFRAFRHLEAQVRITGPSAMTMTCERTREAVIYRYEMVNGPTRRTRGVGP